MNTNFALDSDNAKKGQRRSSEVQSTNATNLNKENKRPISAVMSEDCQSTPSSSISPIEQQQQRSHMTNVATHEPVVVRQSIFSKLTRVEGEKYNLQHQTKFNSLMQSKTPSTNTDQSSPSVTPKTPSVSYIVYGTECDTKANLADKSSKNDLDMTRNNDNVDDEESKRRRGKGGVSISVDSRDKVAINKNNDDNDDDDDGGDDDDDADDDDNRVIPLWPSKSETLGKNSSEFVQHKVYSLKDYSQVANPTSKPPITNAQVTASSAAKSLLKSMSQDRKTKANIKRMSECLYSIEPHGSSTLGKGSTTTAAAEAASSSATATVAAIAATSKQMNTSSASFSVGTTSFSGGERGNNSITSLLQPAPNRQHAALMSESRIDRMRKLFPISLRSSKGGPQSADQSCSMRFQSGASMLNKPQYLMHAMYRTGTSGGHYSRRSPMRPKQGKTFRVYGCPLQMANNIYPITCFGRADIYKQQSVPYILARLCNYIEENSSQLTHEGIFRVSGNARLMDKLRNLFDRLGDAPLESESVDVATSASMLKMYLRELPEPLIPTRMNYYFITLAKKYSPFLSKDNVSSSYSSSGAQYSSSSSSRISKTASPSQTSIIETTNSSSDSQVTERQRLAFSRDLIKLLRKLPIENYNLLKYLACFLYRISLKQQFNKMCAEALGIVFGPNVFRIRSESYKGLKEQELSNQIMASIIGNYKLIFDSELTDPLGNIVGPEDNSKGPTGSSTDKLISLNATCGLSNTGISKKLTLSSSSAESTTNTIKLRNDNNSATIDLSIPAVREDIPITSSSTPEVADIGGSDVATASAPTTSHGDGHSCCSKHCHGYLFDENSEEAEGEVGEGDFRVVDEDDDDYEDDDEDDDDDDDDCDDEGESYTPSTGSGSYCSSMDSETIESSYEDGDDAQIGDNAELASRSNISSSECASNTSYTPTSSHTDSEVDEQDNEESLYGNSSSFESSPSLGHAMATDQEAARFSSKRTNQSSNQQASCLVCRRRESSQMDTISSQNAIAQIVNLEPERATKDRICSREGQQQQQQQQHPEGEAICVSIPVVKMKKQNDIVKYEPSKNQVEGLKQSSKNEGIESNNSQLQHRQLPLTNLRSSRRKRTDSTRKSHILSHSQAVEAAPQSSASLITNKNYSPAQTELGNSSNDHHNIKRTINSSPRSRQEASNKSRHPTSKAIAQQSGGKFDFFRRRSSSASSLSRIKHKRDQLAATTVGVVVTAHNRKSYKFDESQQHPKTGRAWLQVESSRQQKRMHDMRGGTGGTHNSTRKSRGKGHLVRKIAEAPDSSMHHSNLSEQHPDLIGPRSTLKQSSSVRYRGENSKAGCTRGHQHKHRSKSHYYYDFVAPDRVSTLSLSGRKSLSSGVADNENYENVVDIYEHYLGCDFLSAQYLAEEMAYTDKYFLLRSYNSDETLLRSLNYNSEFSQELKSNRQRRRFSGNDFVNEKVGIVQLCHQAGTCNQIFEEDINSGVLKDQIELEKVLDDGNLITGIGITSTKISPSDDDAATASIAFQRPKANEASFETSFVSLIDNRLIGFRKSELSLNCDSANQNQKDPILIQMRAMKDLIKALKRQMKFGSEHGYNSEMEQLVLNLASSTSPASAYNDDFSISQVDYLSARSLAEQFDRISEIGANERTENTPQIKERLNEILKTKIAMFKQRYSDLKNIRDHIIRNHRQRGLQHHHHLHRTYFNRNLDRLMSSSIGAESKDLSKMDSKIHGSLDSLQQQQQQQQQQHQHHKTKSKRFGDAVKSRAERKLSVPNDGTFDRADHQIDNDDSPMPSSNPEVAEHTERIDESASSAIDEHCEQLKDLDESLKLNKQAHGFSPPLSNIIIVGKQGNPCCKFGSLCPVEFVFNIEKLLVSKRVQGNRMINLNELNSEQLQSEKLELQKNLLRYEHWYGRPITKLEYSLVGHLYERYRAVKMIKARKQHQQAQNDVAGPDPLIVESAQAHNC